MRKKSLLGLALLFTATFAGAQDINLPMHKIVKKSNKVSSETTVRGIRPFKGQTNQKGWFNVADMQQKNNIASPLASLPNKAPRKADETTTAWFYYPMSQSGSVYALGFDRLAQYYSSFSVMKGQTQYDVYSEVPYYYANGVIDSLEIMFYDADKIQDSLYVYFIGMNDSTGVTYRQYAFPASEINGLQDGYIVYSTFVLPEKYTVPEGGCYVGYAFEAGVGARPIVSFNNYADYDIQSGSYYFTFYDTDNTRYYIDLASAGWGSLTTAVHMDVSAVSPTNVSIGSIGEQTTLAGQSTNVSAYVYNDALQSINSISYIVTVDGVEQPEATYTFSKGLAAGGYDVVTFLTQNFEEGCHDVTVKITKVDGQTNISESNVANDGYIIALEKGATRQSVVEEITSTSCGYCPRGAVALSKLKENGVITLANHFTYQWKDPMQVNDNIDLGNLMLSAIGGFPGALFDRCIAGDPYFGIGSTGYQADQLSQAIAAAIPSEGTVALTADWADESMTQIKVSTDVTFGYDRLGASYAIGYIISEDGLTGNDSTWLQYNYYAGESAWTQYDGMEKWVNASTYAQTTYDDVVVAVWGSAEGLDGTISSFITKGQAINDSRTLSIANNSLIQDKGCLKVTALLINRNNGCIVNAAQVATRTFTGINAATAANSSVKEVARYNANGQRIVAPQKGLNIVKMSNGKSIKVMVND